MTINHRDIRITCIRLARESDCAKMGFGVVAVFNYGSMGDTVVHTDNNKRHPLLSGFCEGDECIRMKIPSRTQSLIGACAHAEERTVWHLMKYQPHTAIEIEKVSLFVAGVRPDGTVYERMGTEWTCLRCAIVMNYAKINSINFWDQEELISIRPNLALQQAVKYATGEKVWRTQASGIDILHGEVIHVDFPKVDMSKSLRFTPKSDADKADASNR